MRGNEVAMNGLTLFSFQVSYFKFQSSDPVPFFSRFRFYISSFSPLTSDPVFQRLENVKIQGLTPPPRVTSLKIEDWEL